MKRRVLLARALVSAARPAAARRADQPPRHRGDRLARGLPASGLAGSAGVRHPRPRASCARWPRASSRSTAARSPAGPATTTTTCAAARSACTPKRRRTRASTSCWRRKKSGSARASRPAAPATKAACAALKAMRSERAAAPRADRQRAHGRWPQARVLRQEGDRGASDVSFAYGERALRARFLDHDPARRPHRPHRPQRRRQDHAAASCCWASCSRSRRGARSARNLQVAYFDQHRATLREDWNALDNVAEGREFIEVGGSRKHVIGYLQDFLFTPERARAPITRLSGGERNRLLLAKLFAQPSNLLVMDEPTNDLDVETLELLEELLGDYTGHAAAGQPRPRLPRQRRDQHAGAGRRRPRRRVRRRLQRLAAPAPRRVHRACLLGGAIRAHAGVADRRGRHHADHAQAQAQLQGHSASWSSCRA